MGTHPLPPYAPSPEAPTAELTLPPLSPERKETLEYMHARIDAFAEHLLKAQKIFSEPRTREHRSPHAMAAIFNAKQHVECAMRELSSTLHLIDLDPGQVSHIASHLQRASHQLTRIKGLAELLLRATRTTHHSRALHQLALACPRASHELESNLAEPLRRTLRSPINSDEGSCPPALTS